MTVARSIRFRVAAAVLLMLPAVVPARAAVAEVPDLTVDDIVALLEAGVGESVILKQVSLSETRLILTVDMLIQLKKAGASDDLLEALVAPPSRSEGAPETIPVPEEALQDTGHSFRVYSEVDENGDPVVHITNLDKSGRRIGGEVEKTSPPNVVRASEPRREEPARDTDDRQVVVNVYPQESGSSGGAAPEIYEPPDSPYRYRRYAPAYYGLGRPDHHFHTPTCGHLYYYYGRYTPYGYPVYRTPGHGRYFGTGLGVTVPYLGSIRTVPYSFSSAATRNHRVFGRR